MIPLKLNGHFAWHFEKHFFANGVIVDITVVSYSNENFSFKWELPACLFPSTKKEVQQRGDGCKIDHSHLNEKLSFEQDATVEHECHRGWPLPSIHTFNTTRWEQVNEETIKTEQILPFAGIPVEKLGHWWCIWTVTLWTCLSKRGEPSTEDTWQIVMKGCRDCNGDGPGLVWIKFKTLLPHNENLGYGLFQQPY